MFGFELKAMERALDGLSTRFTAQSNNVANVNTPNYQRQVVNFEDSLKAILDSAQGEAKMRFADSWVLRDGRIAIHFAGMVQHPDGSLA